MQGVAVVEPELLLLLKLDVEPELQVDKLSSASTGMKRKQNG